MTLDERIRAGLQKPQKELPSALLYDDLGSMLFEAITLLPEYEVTRAGLRLLERHRGAMVEGPGTLELVELGPGAGRKAKLLLEAVRARQPRASFIGVDVSAQALDDCRKALEQMNGVDVQTVQAEYIAGLARASAQRADHVRWLVLFLGSNLSNFDRPAAQRFLHDVRAQLRAGDAVLLATDLDKAPERLIPAYDDALGVTAAFNKNVLLRVNREFGASFPLEAFVHRARWNQVDRRVEMHLEALRDVETRISALDLHVSLRRGETIWTESSHRFSLEELSAWSTAAGFSLRAQWVDAVWPFAQSLLVVP